jgi:hypothetical protein
VDWGITTVKDVVEVLAYLVQLVAALALITAIFTYLAHRNQLRFDVITNCVERFQEIIPNMGSTDAQEAERAKRRYVDLCNEQLFYFGEKYLPDEVVEEWLDGMIDYLPQLDREGKAHPQSWQNRMVEPELLDGYPRIETAFTVDEPYDLESRVKRGKLIEHLRGKVQKRSRLWRRNFGPRSRKDQ